MAAKTTRLSQHLSVYHGPINVGILRHGRKALLVDCGDGSVARALEDLAITTVDQAVFTHHHRDQACGAHAFADRGARIGVPAGERDHFDKVAQYWRDPKSRWHLYNLHPHHLMLAEPLRVDAAFGDGHTFAWGPAKIRVITTPGHTDGSVSYLVEVDGQRALFCGDCIYGHGQLWDVHSLQHGFGNVTDYHGFLGARPQLVESLGRIQAAKPDALVPSHGRIMREPSKAIAALAKRLDACYDRYVAISALRYYFPQLFREYAGRKGHMPIRKGKAVPKCLRHFGTSWVLVAKDQAALVMDCGGPHVVKALQKLIAKGEIRAVEGLWITHYHDDHVDAVPHFQKAFDCPCITDAAVAGVITDPMAWRLPCISPSKCRVDKVASDGESWDWHEFKLTAYHFPGQTLYHAGLLAEGQGHRMFFSGDSFTPGGIDDYCSSNRNWLGRGPGFDRCIALIEKLKPTHICNCHVPDAFDFTPEQCRFMRATLAERETLFGDLVPWDHANTGMDEPWVRCHPYESRTTACNTVDLRVVVTNHAAKPRKVRSRAVVPRALGGGATEWAEAEIPAKKEGSVSLAVHGPHHPPPRRPVVPVVVRFGSWDLPQFSEAIIVV